MAASASGLAQLWMAALSFGPDNRFSSRSWEPVLVERLSKALATHFATDYLDADGAVEWDQVKKNICPLAYIMFQVSGESRARLFELEMVNGFVTRTECYPGRRGSTNLVVSHLHQRRHRALGRGAELEGHCVPA